MRSCPSLSLSLQDLHQSSAYYRLTYRVLQVNKRVAIEKIPFEELTGVWDLEVSTFEDRRVANLLTQGFCPNYSRSHLPRLLKDGQLLGSYGSLSFLGALANFRILNALLSLYILPSTLFAFLFLSLTKRGCRTNLLNYSSPGGDTWGGANEHFVTEPGRRKIIGIGYPTTPRLMPLHKAKSTTYSNRHNARSMEGQVLVE